MNGVNRIERMRVARRLLVVTRGVETLKRKERILALQLDRLTGAAEQTRTQWETTATGAFAWLTRAQAIEGRAALADAGTTGATLRTEWTTLVGIPLPLHAEVVFPDRPRPPAGPALTVAERTHRAATDAAARHAVALRAVASVSAELAITATRRRAAERHMVPALTQRLRAIDAALKEQELEDIVRTHWIADPATTTRVASRS